MTSATTIVASPVVDLALRQSANTLISPQPAYVQQLPAATVTLDYDPAENQLYLRYKNADTGAIINQIPGFQRQFRVASQNVKQAHTASTVADAYAPGASSTAAAMPNVNTGPTARSAEPTPAPSTISIKI
jgi:hypothetical protein